MIDYQADFGTPERARHGNLRMEPRDIAKGGNIITTGLTEAITSTLDYLKAKRLLGGARDAEARYSAGQRLYALYCRFGDTQPTKDIGTPGRGTSGINEGEIGDAADIAETIYHAVMRHRKMEFRKQMVRHVCIEGTLSWPCHVNVNPRYIEQLQDALDVLEGVLMEVEKEFDN